MAYAYKLACVEVLRLNTYLYTVPAAGAEVAKGRAAL
jgi:hypothetical protein